MRRWAVTLTVLTLCGHALPKDRRPGPALPGQFEIGRHTFIDVGPPNDFYELFLVRPAAAGTSIERITLTPAADACLQPAKLEVASASLNESGGTLLGKTNPCTIREKELRRELKRCKKCLVFSGANVQVRVQCGAKTHIIRSDILDKDVFDPAPKLLSIRPGRCSFWRAWITRSGRASWSDQFFLSPKKRNRPQQIPTRKP